MFKTTMFKNPINIPNSSIISLGSVCGIKMWQLRCMILQKTYIFDWVGVNPYILKEILKTPKPILFTNEYYQENSKEAVICSDGRNDARVNKMNLTIYPHHREPNYNIKNPRGQIYMTNEELTEKMNNRLNIFYKEVLYNKEKFIIFIHMEHNTKRMFNKNLGKHTDNIICKCDNINNFSYKQAQFNFNHIKNLAGHIKTTFPCKFVIIFLSKYLPENTYSNNTIGIKLDYTRYTDAYPKLKKKLKKWENDNSPTSKDHAMHWPFIIQYSLNKNSDYIKNIIKKIQGEK